jgi:hypothetical protein
MSRAGHICWSLACLLISARAASAQATSPATTGAAEGPIRAVINGVEGNVQVRDHSDQPWRKARSRIPNGPEERRPIHHSAG